METRRHKRLIPWLVVGACLIWGGVFYRIAGMQRGKVLLSPSIPVTEIPEKEQQLLRLDYRDPFLGKLKAISREVAVAERQIPQDTAGPGFRLLARIRKGNKDFLVIDRSGTRELVTTRQKIDGFSVRKVTSGAIVVSKSNRLYTLVVGE